MNWKRTIAPVALLAAVTIVAGCTSSPGEPEEAAEWPTGQITIVAPGAAGNSADNIARTLALAMEDELGYSVIVENTGTETEGMSRLKDDEPDGYTMAIAPSGLMTVLPMANDTGYGPGTEDFDIVAQVAVAPAVLLVAADSPMQDLEDFVAAAKGSGVQVGGTAGGGIPGLSVALLSQEADAPNYTWVDFQAGEQMLALLNGTVDAAVSLTPVASQFVAAGEMRVLTMFSADPIDGFDAPLTVDSGDGHCPNN